MIYASNMQTTEIRRFTNLLAPVAVIYAVYVSRTPGVKLFPIYEAQLMLRYGPGNTAVVFYVVYVVREYG